MNTLIRNGELKDSENVVAYIEGSEKPDEIIVVSAHLDHVGVNEEGVIYNGADDDGSGTVAILEIAEAFKKAQMESNGPRRSILFTCNWRRKRAFGLSLLYRESHISYR